MPFKSLKTTSSPRSYNMTYFMTHFMERLESLIGSDAAQDLLNEFGGQVIFQPIADSFPILERSQQERALVDAAILTEFNGSNHSELARRHHVSISWVYRLLKQSVPQSVTQALQPIAGNGTEVVWAAALAQVPPLQALEAGLQAFEKAKAHLQTEADSQGRHPLMQRLLVAIVVLPPTHPAVLMANSPEPRSAAPIADPLGIPDPADSSPTR
jgi:hypothetical protein